jgi:hypothetical protein
MIDVGIACEGVPLAFGGTGTGGAVFTPCVCLLKVHRRLTDQAAEDNEEAARFSGVASSLLRPRSKTGTG